MVETVVSLEELGLAAAEYLAGDSAVKQVEVAPGEDSSHRPVYQFSFLIDREQARMRLGLLQTRLSQRLRDDLDALGDEHLVAIRLLNNEDWHKRANARSG